MTRSQFLKSLIMVVAAPKIIPEVASSRPHQPQHIAVFFKVHRDFFKPEYKVDAEHIFKEQMFKHNLDRNKPYTIETGYDNDDFSRGLLTVIIKQRI